MWKQLLDRLQAMLQEDESLKDITFTKILEDRNRSILREPLAAIGISSADLKRPLVALGDTEGSDGITGIRNDFVVSIMLYVPKRMGACACSELFAKISSVLMRNNDVIRAKGIHCGEVSYQSAAQALCAEMKVETSAYWKWNGGGAA